MVGVLVIGPEHDFEELAGAGTELLAGALDGAEGRRRIDASKIKENCVKCPVHGL